MYIRRSTCPFRGWSDSDIWLRLTYEINQLAGTLVESLLGTEPIVLVIMHHVVVDQLVGLLRQFRMCLADLSNEEINLF